MVTSRLLPRRTEMPLDCPSKRSEYKSKHPPWLHFPFLSITVSRYALFSISYHEAIPDISDHNVLDRSRVLIESLCPQFTNHYHQNFHVHFSRQYRYEITGTFEWGNHRMHTRSWLIANRPPMMVSAIKRHSNLQALRHRWVSHTACLPTLIFPATVR